MNEAEKQQRSEFLDQVALEFVNNNITLTALAKIIEPFNGRTLPEHLMDVFYRMVKLDEYSEGLADLYCEASNGDKKIKYKKFDFINKVPRIATKFSKDAFARFETHQSLRKFLGRADTAEILKDTFEHCERAQTEEQKLEIEQRLRPKLAALGVAMIEQEVQKEILENGPFGKRKHLGLAFGRAFRESVLPCNKCLAAEDEV